MKLLQSLAPAFAPVLLAVVLSAGAVAQGQSTAADPTPQSIEERLKNLSGLPLEENQRIRYKELCESTLALLKEASDWEARATALDEQRRKAPEQIAELRASLNAAAREVQLPEFEALSLSALEQQLAETETLLSRMREQLSAHRQEQQRRSDRKVKVSDERLTLQRLEETLQAERLKPPPEGEPAELAEALRWQTSAKLRAAQAQLRAIGGELPSYEASDEVLTAQLDLANRRIAASEDLVRKLRQLVEQRRQQEAAFAAEQARQRAAQAHPAVQALAHHNAEIAERRTGLAGKTQQAATKRDEISQLRRTLREREQALKSKLEIAGRTTVHMGSLLLEQKKNLPELANHYLTAGIRSEELQKIEFALFEMGEERRRLTNLEPFIQAQTDALAPELSADEKEAFRTEVRKLYEARREIVSSLIVDYERYLTNLRELNSEEQQLIQETERALAFINANIVWIPNTGTAWDAAQATALVDSFVELFSLRNLSSIPSALKAGVLARPVSSASLLVLLITLLCGRSWSRRKVRILGDEAARGSTMKFGPTLVALLHTALLVPFFPLCVWLPGWIIQAAPEPSSFLLAVAIGLQRTALVVAALEVIRQLCRPHGIADAHFHWPSSVAIFISRELWWFMPVASVMAFFIATLEWYGNEAHEHSIGRLAFLVLHLTVAVFALRILAATRKLLKSGTPRGPLLLFSRVQYLWYLVGFGVPLALVGLAVIGYHYTAVTLAWRFWASLFIIFGFLTVEAILFRWWIIHRRNLEIERRMRLQPVTAQPVGENQGQLEVRETEPDLSQVHRQTRTMLGIVMWTAISVTIWFSWAEVLPALKIFDQVELWTTENSGTVTLGNLLFALLVTMLSSVAARNVPGFLEVTFLKLFSKESGSRHSLATILRYVILVGGMWAACSAIRVEWEKLQWLVAALGVGIGFGLKDIFNNFISGLIILTDRRIRVGDVITVDGISGTVSQIDIRATTITDYDFNTVVIPNELVRSKIITNKTLHNHQCRLVFTFRVAYNSNMQKVFDCLLQVAQANPHVPGDPASTVLVHNILGENAVNVDLRVVLPNLEHWLEVRNSIPVAVLERFRSEGIEVPFPQRDVHVRLDSGLGTDKTGTTAV